jgi:hypothetical protein
MWTASAVQLTRIKSPMQRQAHRAPRRHNAGDRMVCRRQFEYKGHAVTVCLDEHSRPASLPRHKYAASYSVQPPGGSGLSWQQFPTPSFDSREDAEVFAADSARASVDEAMGLPAARYRSIVNFLPASSAGGT